MKFEINLNKVDTKTLAVFVELKRKKLMKEIKNNVVVDEREKLMKELGAKKDVMPVIETATEKRKYFGSRKKLDFVKLAEEARRLVRTTNEQYLVTQLYNIIRGFPKGHNPGGSSVIQFKNELEKRLYGIRKIKLGKTRIGYVNKKNYTGKKSIKTGRVKHISEETRDYLTKRGKFVMSRCYSLMKSNQYMTREKALTIASGEWKQQEKKQTQPTTFDNEEMANKLPNISGIEKEYKPILASMLKYMALNHTKLKFEETSYALAVSNYAIWNDFLSSIMLHSGTICSILGIENKFKISKYGEHNMLEYH